MHDKGKGAGAAPAFSAASERDVDDQSKVMREVLEVNPEIRTRDELVRELTVASTDFEERDRIERANRGGKHLELPRRVEVGPPLEACPPEDAGLKALGDPCFESWRCYAHRRSSRLRPLLSGGLGEVDVEATLVAASTLHQAVLEGSRSLEGIEGVTTPAVRAGRNAARSNGSRSGARGRPQWTHSGVDVG